MTVHQSNTQRRYAAAEAGTNGKSTDPYEVPANADDDGPPTKVAGTATMSEWNVTDDDFYNITKAAANHTGAFPVEHPQSDTWPVSVIAIFLGLALIMLCAHRMRSSRQNYQQIQNVQSLVV